MYRMSPSSRFAVAGCGLTIARTGAKVSTACCGPRCTVSFSGTPASPFASFINSPPSMPTTLLSFIATTRSSGRTPAFSAGASGITSMMCSPSGRVSNTMPMPGVPSRARRSSSRRSCSSFALKKRAYGSVLMPSWVAASSSAPMSTSVRCCRLSTSTAALSSQSCGSQSGGQGDGGWVAGTEAAAGTTAGSEAAGGADAGCAPTSDAYGNAAAAAAQAARRRTTRMGSIIGTARSDG
ncbi:hypothetical protein BO443_140007 [Burkholderia orbicola]